MVDLFRRACFCRSEYGSFGFHLCFDAAMGFPGDGTFALTSKLKAKETARFKAEAEAENEKEKKRKAGESVAAEFSSSTCVQQELEHAFVGCAAFRDRITIHRAHVMAAPRSLKWS